MTNIGTYEEHQTAAGGTIAYTTPQSLLLDICERLDESRKRACIIKESIREMQGQLFGVCIEDKVSEGVDVPTRPGEVGALQDSAQLLGTALSELEEEMAELVGSFNTHERPERRQRNEKRFRQN